ncbi:MAG: energy transducer TonB [Halopseudomonas sp.]|uniref:energy transducer TonB n=1 Tax=Halopseudomonas sp. TaxID=2901191 RepID=UPI003001BADE
MSIDNTAQAALIAVEQSLPSSRRVWFLPLIATLTLHAGAASLIYLGWQPQPPSPPEAARSIRTQLVVMPAPAAVPIGAAPAVPEPEPLPEPVAQPAPAAIEPPAPTPARQPEPVATPPDPAAIARKHAEQQRQQALARQQQLEEAAAKAQQLAEAQTRARQQAAEQQAARQRAAAAAAAKAADVSSYTPIRKAAPDYPRRALSSRLEGDCTVEYRVLADGRVSDPHIVPGACEEPIFIRPSLAAAKDFVYQPRMINGQAVAVPGVRNTFRYRLATVSRP